MNQTSVQQLQRQIEILKEVLVLRENGEVDSPFVCDNVDAVTGNCNVAGGAGYTIRRDIKQYINYEWSVLEWLYERNGIDYEHDDPEVEAERIKMVNTLIARYEEVIAKVEA